MEYEKEYEAIEKFFGNTEDKFATNALKEAKETGKLLAEYFASSAKVLNILYPDLSPADVASYLYAEVSQTIVDVLAQNLTAP